MTFGTSQTSSGGSITPKHAEFISSRRRRKCLRHCNVCRSGNCDTPCIPSLRDRQRVRTLHSSHPEPQSLVPPPSQDRLPHGRKADQQSDRTMSHTILRCELRTGHQYSDAMTRFLQTTVLLLSLAGCSRQPQGQIIHLCDWHFVSREDFAADLRDQSREPISDVEIDRQYAAFLNTVESVQVEQAAILRGLMREHGIRQVFVEGLTNEKVAAFRQAVYDLRGFDFDRLHERLIDESLDSEERAALQDAINTLRTHRLELGAVAQLILADEPIDVAPLDDPKLMELAGGD